MVEVIIALALLGIISISFITLFTTGFRFIMMSAWKTEALNELQRDMEAQYASGTDEVKKLTLTFNNGTIIEVKGDYYDHQLTEPIGPFNQNVKIAAYYPKSTIVKELSSLKINLDFKDNNKPDELIELIEVGKYVYSLDIENGTTILITATPSSGYDTFINDIKQTSYSYTLSANKDVLITVRVENSDINGSIERPITYTIIINNT